jgi:glycosyltransferase involved in cell wall biosynthesis
MRRNILFFHGPGLFYGGTEKFLQIVAKYLSKEFGVYYAYAPADGLQRKEYFDGTEVRLLPFVYSYKQNREPYAYKDMAPKIFEMIQQYRIDVVFTPVSAHYQFPLNVVSANMPFIITSPFGHYASNGNVQLIYVYGQENMARLVQRGVKNLELAYDPIDDFAPEYLQKDYSGDQVVFGRVGRADNSIFDPISIMAYARLEKKYGRQVRYELLSPPPAMLAVAKELGLKNIVVDPGTAVDYLGKFYQRIHVLAHARKDGETLGKAIAEAMMAGLPIVTHQSHTHNEHINFMSSDFARWCAPDDVDAYFANMEWFVVHRSEIPRMGQLARIRALELFGVDKRMPAIAVQIAEVINASRYQIAGPIERLKGCIQLRYTNLIGLPFFLVKLAAMYFPGFGKWAAKVYRSHVYRKIFMVTYSPAIQRLARKISAFFQTQHTSFALHDAEFSEPGKLEKERAVAQQYLEEGLFNSPENKLADMLNAHPEVRAVAVDIGAGAGWCSAELSKYFKQVIALEPSSAASTIAKQLYPREQYPAIYWREGFAAPLLTQIYLTEPALFVTCVVLTHLRDREVIEICRSLSKIALVGSILSFNEAWGFKWHQHMWHIRTQEWWQTQLPEWRLDFHGPVVDRQPKYNLGFHGVKLK